MMWWREGPSRRQDPAAAALVRRLEQEPACVGKTGEGEPLVGGAA
jgi:hypothetical protein